MRERKKNYLIDIHRDHQLWDRRRVHAQFRFRN